jgi:hypothetical protein
MSDLPILLLFIQSVHLAAGGFREGAHIKSQRSETVGKRSTELGIIAFAIKP